MFIDHGARQNHDTMPPHPPKDIHILIPGTCECVTLSGKRDFTDVTKGHEMGDYPELLSHGLLTEKRKAEDWVERCDMWTLLATAGFEGRGRDP